jgi:hypothetical protein
MNLDVDFLINFYNDNSKYYSDELSEQDDVGSTSSSGGESSGGKTPKKWESGLTRGKSNPIALTPWISGRQYGKTYMNDPKYVWKSDRVMGKTGGSDYA